MVGVDQPRQDDHAAGVDDRVGIRGQFGGRAGLDDGVVTDEEPAVGDAPPRRVHGDEQVGMFEE